jgi:hypothetical protein
MKTFSPLFSAAGQEVCQTKSEQSHLHDIHTIKLDLETGQLFKQWRFTAPIQQGLVNLT